MNKNKHDNDRFISPKELAYLWSVPISWVYSHTADGSLPHRKVGRYVRFWVPDIMTWLDANGR